jgi:hypothetical protein
MLLLAWATDAQTVPTLSISLVAPSLARVSWPSSFTGWQLTSTTNLDSPLGWQAVPIPPTPMDNENVVTYPLDANQRCFRLTQGTVCAFQATPPVIAPGQSSTLSWCPVPATTYTLIPGPGSVSGSNYLVSPATTTTYVLLASNVLGSSVSFATVTVAVSACDFASVTNLDGTVDFTYDFSVSSALYDFAVHQAAHLSVHLTQSEANLNSATFTGIVAGNDELNDKVTEYPSPPRISTLVGSGPPVTTIYQVNASKLTLTVDCTTGTYSFTITPWISATLTDPDGSTTSPWAVGGVNVNQRPLPATLGAISGSGALPARGPFWTGGGDLYAPAGLAQGMFTTGTVTDTTAGTASVDWSFTPVP